MDVQLQGIRCKKATEPQLYELKRLLQEVSKAHRREQTGACDR